MTTDIQVSIAEDLFAPNDVLSFSRASRSDSDAIALSALRFETHAGGDDARKQLRRTCIEAARQRLLSEWPTLTMWLFACHTAWQPKNRISIYRGLWKSLEQSNIIVPSGEKISETRVETDRGVRFFGVVGVPTNEEERAYEVLDAESASFLIVSTEGRQPDIGERLISVWKDHRQSNLSGWAGLASIACQGGGILFRPFGFFDDVEVGTDVILETRNLRRLANITR